MRRAVYEVALINVIWPHAAHEEFVHERLHRFEIVVHTGEQHALIPERYAGVRESLKCFFDFNRQFARMINVHAHPERMIFRQDRAQLWRDALWQKDRNARANAKKFNVLYRAQPTEQLVELVVAENERVAAAEQDIAHFGVLLKIPE